jgi:Fe-S-cluster containining protein
MKLTKKLQQHIKAATREMPKKSKREYIDSIMGNIEDVRKHLLTYEDTSNLTMATIGMLEVTIAKQLPKNVIPCKKGCDECCHIHTSCFNSEMDVIMNYIKAYSIEVDRTALELKASLDQLALDKGPDFWLEHVTYENRACVFLKDGSCQIYPVRPLVCRTHFSAMDSSEYCNTKDGITRMVAYLVLPWVEIIITAYESLQSQPEGLPKMLFALDRLKMLYP